MPSGPDASLIEIERLRVVFQQLPLTLSVTLLNAALTAYVLAPVTSHGALSVWLALIAGLASHPLCPASGFLPPPAGRRRIARLGGRQRCRRADRRQSLGRRPGADVPCQ